MKTSRRSSFLATTSVILAILCSPPTQAQTETQKLVLGTPATDAWLGYAVSITNDITVGQSRSGMDGSITVFRRLGTTWSQEDVLFVPDTQITGIEHSTIANSPFGLFFRIHDDDFMATDDQFFHQFATVWTNPLTVFIRTLLSP